MTTSLTVTSKWSKLQVGAPATAREPSERLKRSFDVAAAAAMFLMFLPLFGLICFILLTQGRPLMIRHRRVGRGGATFPCLKFRTMVVDSDAVLQRHLASDPAAREEWEASRKLKNDPRVTALGRVLRKTSIDELPQLLNVLRGEMSLVGPRPIVPAEVIHYGIHIERYHEVRPGLTGAWQISGRSDVSYEQRVALDCAYVAERSFRRDLGILVKTVPAVLKSKGSY
ncbi:sugar transferase [Lichenibacterium ramalinae]|uniref:Sugar transferase n=1 Tax=Lichenibacterium ramalinae TaxID=2316527 RepID=A0A4Q2RI41_9HYPH|nr:sugar transferase [Lichenibacterium ramalinae]